MYKGPEAESPGGPGVTEEDRNVVSKMGAWSKGQARKESEIRQVH